MKKTRLLFTIFLFVAFLAGIYAIITLKTNTIIESENKTENMDNTTAPKQNTDCPDMLIEKGNTIVLYNSKKPIDENNPIPFFNLDEYINYLEIQKKKGVSCPVLYLKAEYNAQGEEIFRMRPSPFDLQPGLPASIPNELSLKEFPIVNVVDANREHPPYNSNNYHGFDGHGLYVGKYTDLDKLHDSTRFSTMSDNPMDPNWGGVEYTKKIVDSGKYVDNNVVKPIFATTQTVFYPNLPNMSNMAQPIDIL